MLKGIIYPYFSWHRDSDFEKDEDGKPLCFSMSAFDNGALVLKTFHPHENDGKYIRTVTYYIKGTAFEKTLKSLAKQEEPLIVKSPLGPECPVSLNESDYVLVYRGLFGPEVNREPKGIDPEYVMKKEYDKYTTEDYKNAVGSFLNEVASLFEKKKDGFKIIHNGVESSGVGPDIVRLVGVNSADLPSFNEQMVLVKEFHDELPALSQDPSALNERNALTEQIRQSIVAFIPKFIDKAVLHPLPQKEYDRFVIGYAHELSKLMNAKKPAFASSLRVLSEVFAQAIANGDIINEKTLVNLHPDPYILMRYGKAHNKDKKTLSLSIDYESLLEQYRNEAAKKHLFPLLYEFTEEGSYKDNTEFYDEKPVGLA